MEEGGGVVRMEGKLWRIVTLVALVGLCGPRQATTQALPVQHSTLQL